MGDSIRVIVVDDQTLVREGVRALIEAHDGIEVVGEAENGKAALMKVRELSPDVVVMDLSMPELNGIEATRQIARSFPRTRILALTMYGDEKYVFQALKAGAAGYILKTATGAELAGAIRAVHGGSPYFSAAVSRKIMDSYLSEDDKTTKSVQSDHLTGREREVLQLVAEGYSNTKVAELMGISVKTVETHRSNIMKKVGVHDVTGLVKYAIKRGIIIL